MRAWRQGRGQPSRGHLNGSLDGARWIGISEEVEAGSLCLAAGPAWPSLSHPCCFVSPGPARQGCPSLVSALQPQHSPVPGGFIE